MIADCHRYSRIDLSGGYHSLDLRLIYDKNVFVLFRLDIVLE